MKKGQIIVLSVAGAFMIIGIHQTITLGFEVAYWLFMVSLSLYFLSRLMSQKESEKPKKPKKSKRQQGNRQSKRFMKRVN